MGGTWSALLMSGYLFMPALILLLFSTFTVIVCQPKGHTINFTATPATVSDKVLSVVKVKETWFGAVQYCRDNRLGHLVHGGVNGNRLVYIRHQLLLGDWNNTDFLWTNFVKPSSSETFYRALRCKAMPGIEANNASSTEQQCLAVNMTTDNMQIDWLATSCENKYNFVCVKQKDEIPNNNLANYVITTTDPVKHVSISSTPNTNLTDCMEECSSLINRFASVYDVTTSECQHYTMHVHFMPVNVVVEESIENKVVCVKNLSFAIKYYFPDSGHNVTEAAGEIVPLFKQNTNTCSKIMSGTPDGTTTGSPEGTTIGSTEGMTIDPSSGTTIGPTEPKECDENTHIMCLCGVEQFQNISAEDLLLKLKLLKEDLTVEKTSLSSYKRKRFSAPDDRTSAQVIGVAGALVIAGVIVSIIILDLQYLIKFAYRVKARF